MKRWTILAFSLLVMGCGAAKPVLYPNSHLNQVGPAQADLDMQECTGQAEAYVKSNPGAQVAGNTAVGAGAGTAIGAAAGAVTGNLGRGAAVGAATGATSGLIRGLFKASEPSPTHKRFVEKCLRDKGYEPIGWE